MRAGGSTRGGQRSPNNGHTRIFKFNSSLRNGFRLPRACAFLSLFIPTGLVVLIRSEIHTKSNPHQWRPSPNPPHKHTNSPDGRRGLLPAAGGPGPGEAAPRSHGRLPVPDARSGRRPPPGRDRRGRSATPRLCAPRLCLRLATGDDARAGPLVRRPAHQGLRGPAAAPEAEPGLHPRAAVLRRMHLHARLRRFRWSRQRRRGRVALRRGQDGGAVAPGTTEPGGGRLGARGCTVHRCRDGRAPGSLPGGH